MSANEDAVFGKFKGNCCLEIKLANDLFHREMLLQSCQLLMCFSAFAEERVIGARYGKVPGRLYPRAVADPAFRWTESMRAPEHYVAMMQIDCEVVNTKLLHIHQSAIPTPPSNHSAPTGGAADRGVRLNDTGAARGKLNFPAAPTDGLAVDTALRWNDSAPFGRREKAKPRRTARQRASPSVPERTPRAPANSSADSWRRLRFRNDSVDGARVETTFGLAADSERGQYRARRPRPADSGAEEDYFRSEH